VVDAALAHPSIALLLALFAAGFCAQLVDGALGMAFGLLSTSALLWLGVPIANASAIVHTAECATTAASALSHRAFGNIDRRFFVRLAVPGAIGAMLGAWLVSVLDGGVLKPFIALYLLALGVLLLVRRRALAGAEPPRHIGATGFVGATVDAIGGGGFGSTVTTRLLASDQTPRKVIGSVSAAEFFVTLSASATFFLTLGPQNLPLIVALGMGGLCAAPLGAYLVTRVPQVALKTLVGVLVIAISLHTLWVWLSLGN
jgi:uncharacterized protein